MHIWIDTALNIGDTGLFSSGSDMICICNDDVLWRVSFKSTSWWSVDWIANKTFECLSFGRSGLQRKLGVGLRCLTLYYLGPCLTCTVRGNTIFIATHPKRDCCCTGVMIRKVMPMQQLLELNAGVRGRQTCGKILKLADSALDGGV